MSHLKKYKRQLERVSSLDTAKKELDKLVQKKCKKVTALADNIVIHQMGAPLNVYLLIGYSTSVELRISIRWCDATRDKFAGVLENSSFDRSVGPQIVYASKSFNSSHEAIEYCGANDINYRECNLENGRLVWSN